MSQLPINPLSPEEQQRVRNQIYRLCGKQVQSYHKHRHMGQNSSVPVELAQELMESIEYTIGLVGGVSAHANLDEVLLLGQEIVKSRLSKAKSMLELVNGTAPQWQTEFRWETLRCLRNYLDHYDPLHLAHRSPEDLYYPVLISEPEGIRGIDRCLFYLNVLWIENQIMAAIPDDIMEPFWDRLPAMAINQCEHLLINGMGKALLGLNLESLLFEPEERVRLAACMKKVTEEQLCFCAERLRSWLKLKDEGSFAYVKATIPALIVWTGNHVAYETLNNLFI